MTPSSNDAAILAIERPHPSLFTYYWGCLLLFPPLLPVLIVPMWFRYHTMRYTFTAEGISMRWGILFRREVIVNYARIQDIHLIPIPRLLAMRPDGIAKWSSAALRAARH